MAEPLSTRIGHGLAWFLRIKLDDYRDPLDKKGENGVTRGESIMSVSSADSYIEEAPTSLDWILEVLPSGRDMAHYLYSLFPFVHWITRYNVIWLLGDTIAGKSRSEAQTSANQC